MKTKQNTGDIVDPNPIVLRLQGRVSQLLRHGRVKDPELMQTAVEYLTEFVDAAQCLLNDMGEPDDGVEASYMSRLQGVIDRVNGTQRGAA